MLLADLAFTKACPSHRFLEEMANVVPWDLFEQQLTQHLRHKAGGRPPYPRLLLFKLHLLQLWHGLSDAQTEFQCHDRLSFRKFLGLGIDARIPDSTTLENFRHELRASGLDERLLNVLDAFFKQQGLLLKEGNVVDATFVKANARPKKDPDQQSDVDAEWGHKGFGYSATVNTDRKSKLIRRVVVTSERAHDSQHLEAVLVGDEQAVLADSAYEGCAKALKERGIKAYTLKKRRRGKKHEPTPPLPLRDKYRNKVIAKLRAVGEHPFAVLKEVFGV